MCPGFLGVGLVELRWWLYRKEFMMSQYPRVFRRKVLYLLETGPPVKHVAADLGLSQQTVYNWRTQDAIDQSSQPGLTTPEHAELAAVRIRIRQLEKGVRVLQSGRDLVEEVPNPKGFTLPSTG
jgi:transposase-like protein